MSDYLPANATAAEKAMAEAIARISDIPIMTKAVWNADTCPSAVLPWLAWAFSVDTWDTSWSDDQKRGAIKSSLHVHRHKGTIGAVRDALAGLGIGAEVQEWFNQTPAGDPYTFRLVLESSQTPVTQAGIAVALSVVNSAKNLRSHLDDVTIVANSYTGPVVASAVGIGNEITVEFASTVCALVETMGAGPYTDLTGFDPVITFPTTRTSGSFSKTCAATWFRVDLTGYTGSFRIKTPSSRSNFVVFDHADGSLIADHTEVAADAYVTFDVGTADVFVIAVQSFDSADNGTDTLVIGPGILA